MGGNGTIVNRPNEKTPPKIFEKFRAGLQNCVPRQRILLLDIPDFSFVECF